MDLCLTKLEQVLPNYDDGEDRKIGEQVRIYWDSEEINYELNINKLTKNIVEIFKKFAEKITHACHPFQIEPSAQPKNLK